MKLLILGILFSFSTLAFGQQLACEKFKNGKFIIIDAEHGNSNIERKGSKQIEEGEKSGFKATFKVKWIDECTYTLTLNKVLKNPNKLDVSDNMILTVQIIETKENSYIQRATSNLFDMVLESEMIRVD